ncbi:fimbrial protein [Zestomonas carbonaria]|uniref:Type 1 fimbrial protein n=1 Tax=Zestomonas carbonaria TaxID=2762745 RepID=A0A7U7EQK6_9GAMM|nr:fimbrial protein [Pseudomonas carbonaria]CAD5109324.1 hypothetical protein PSEWESI4_03621 [Pseudomonas carbonaria]
MKKTVIAGSLFTALTALFATSAQASSGSVTLSAMISDSTCEASVDQGGADGVLNFNLIPSSAFKNAGDTAGDMPFSIAITNCGDGIFMRPKFEMTSVNPSTGNLANTASMDPTNGLEARILNNSLEPIDLRTNENNPLQEIKDGVSEFRYVGQLIRTDDDFSTGNFSSVLTYTLSYN